MRRKMEAVSVYNEDGMVYIDQDLGGGDVARVAVTADQVNVLIKWLQECAKEIEQQEQADDAR